jgi:hypothetical protein
MRDLRFATAAMLLLTALGCDECDPAVSRIPTPSAVLSHGADETPPLELLEVPLPPTLLGDQHVADLTLTNIGGRPLEVELMGFTGDVNLCPEPSNAFSVGVAAPFSLATDEEMRLPVSFTPTSGATSCAVLEVHSNDEQNPILRALITGQGDAPQLCADPIAVDFGQVFLGDTAEDTVALTSCGTRPITITSLTPNEHFPPFGADLPSTPLTLAPGENVDVPVSFAPEVAQLWSTATGTAGIIAIETDDASAYQITLTGEGRRPPSCDLRAIPEQVQFGTVASGRSSAQNVVVRNLGDLDCTVDSIEVRAPAGSFSVTLPSEFSPGMTLAPLALLTVEVGFAPGSAAGVENGWLDVSSSDPVVPVREVPLEGNSVEPTPCMLEATPTAVNFGNQAVGRSTEVEVQLTNVGTESCSVSGYDLLNGAPHFSVLGDTFPLVGTPLTVGNSLTFLVTYRPEAAGQHSGNVRVTFREGGFSFPPPADMTLDVPLLGNGIAPQLCVNPQAIDFGNVAVNSTADEIVNVVNCGAVGILVRGLQLRAGTHPDFSFSGGPQLPTELDSGASFNVTVRAAPTSAAEMFGTLEVLSDDPSVPSWPVQLRANAPACAAGLVCTPDPLNYGPVDVGQGLVRAVTCTNPGNASVSLTPTVTGPFEVVNAPATIVGGGLGTITVRYEPDGTGADTGVLDTGANSCSGGPVHVDLLGTGEDNFLPECPTPQAFTPEVVWHWEGGGTLPNSKQVWVTPLVTRLEDTDNDTLVTREDVPRVVFISFDHSESPGLVDMLNEQNQDNFNDPTPGVLRAVDGKTGAELWTVDDPRFRLNSSVTPVAADIDADGQIEIIAQKWIVLEGVEDFPNGPKVKGKFVRGNLLAFEHDGTFKWESEEWIRSSDEIEDAGALSVGDVDGDGFAEIAVGDHLFDHNGNLLWRGGKGTGSTGHGPTSVLADVDGQPGLELVAGRTVYRSNGAVLWSRDDLNTTVLGIDMTFDGHPAVGDLDGDGTNEVVVRSGDLVVFDGATGATLAGPITPPTRMSHGAECEPNPNAGEGEDDDCNVIPTNPALVDVDGDGDLEIINTSQDVLVVYDENLNEIWRAAISDQTGAAGPIGFDFEADGLINVVYSDEGNTWVYDEAGAAIYDASRGSVTMMETAAIADINVDGHANMVVGSNEPQFGLSDGIDMLSNAGTSWAHARSIWNQHAYIEPLVGELGTPLYYPDGMAALTGFRTASAACE